MGEKKLSGLSCAKCGEPLYKGDMFCGNCGAKVNSCVKCGAILPPDADFCHKCGHSLVLLCKVCGAKLLDDAVFCSKCGNKVSESVSGDNASAVSGLAVLPSQPTRPSYKVGSYVTFGRYPQNNGDKPEPIEWQVLENDGKTVLLLAKYGLDCQPFHHEWVDVGWDNCDLRKWLNGEFFNKAFNADEQKQIADSKIYTGDNPDYGTKGCGETQDKVFCLSIEEANKCFVSHDARKCQLTAYAVSRNAWKSDDGCCWFWLRSPGRNARYTAYVHNFGAVLSRGCDVYLDYYAVRPALRIILNNNAYLPDNAKDVAVTGDSAEKVSAVVLNPKTSEAESDVQTSFPQADSKPAFAVGSYVTFGRYPQNNGDKPEPIEWQVLENDGNTALLLAKYGLDCKPFHHDWVDIGWDNCDLRKWLNGEFFYKAFNADEQKQIAESRIYTGYNPFSGIKGCGETQDKVFCLGTEEAYKYFYADDADDEDDYGYTVNYARACEPTDYAVGQGAYKKEEKDDAGYGNCRFWLRSPGIDTHSAAFVYLNGAVDYIGNDVYSGNFAVRPALRIILNINAYLPDNAKDVAVTGDSAEKISEVVQKTKVVYRQAENKQAFAVGSYVTFGRYPQNNGDKPEPIEWQVLENDGKTALLLAKYGLGCQPFHHDWVDIGWDNCDLRKWLNREFFNKAFNADEQKQIADSRIYTGNNPDYGTSGCGETQDKVFCLSIEEANKYFASDNARKCQPTAYAVSRNAYKDSDTGYCWFWLRSPGNDADLAACVDIFGAVYSGGYVNDGFFAVRPALRIIL